MKSAEQKFELRNIKRRRRTAAKVNRRWNEVRPAVMPNQFLQERLTKSRGLGAIQQIFVKRTVRTDPRAKGDVNVQVADHTSTSFRAESKNRAAKPPGYIAGSFGCAQDDTEIAGVVIHAVTHKIRLPPTLPC